MSWKNFSEQCLKGKKVVTCTQLRSQRATAGLNLVIDATPPVYVIGVVVRRPSNSALGSSSTIYFGSRRAPNSQLAAQVLLVYTTYSSACEAAKHKPLSTTKAPRLPSPYEDGPPCLFGKNIYTGMAQWIVSDLLCCTQFF